MRSEQEVRHQALLDAIPDLVFLISSDGVYLDFHAPPDFPLLAPPSQFLGKTLAEVMPPEIAELAKQHIGLALTEGKVQAFDYELAIGGVARHYEARIVVAGKNEAVAIVRDVSEHKRAERRQLDAEAQLRRVLDSIPDYVWMADFDSSGRIVHHYYSPVVERITGRPAAFFLEDSTRWLEIMHDDDRPRVTQVLDRLLRSSDQEVVEYRIRRADGSIRWVRDHATARRLDNGVTQLHGVVSDITGLKQAEAERLRMDQRIQQAQKNESLAVLAGGVAHDFNNLLVAILGNAELALLDLPAASGVRETVQEIMKAGRRAAELTNQMLAYSGRSRFVVQKLHMSTLVRDMVQLLTCARRATSSNQILLHTELEDPLPAIEADATQVRQIVMNLITNAFEAIGGKRGDVHVTTGAVHMDRQSWAETAPGTELAPGQYVYLEVSDNGCGMSEETRERVFDPFFSTKSPGRGLGLAALLGIVRGHQGAVTLTSQLGVGSVFRVLLPACAGEAVRAAESGGSPSPGRASGTVLVVDNERGVRIVAAGMLEKAGFAVLTAADGRQALEIVRTRNAEISLVLLDSTMPELSGERVFEEIARLHPQLPVVLSSGFGEAEVMGRFPNLRPAGFIQKPYQHQELVDKIRGVLHPVAKAAG